ncbi:hypothetical protein CDAR_422231 [Caerostris darwini]|uniref:Uncharacterized protein n=1 Tax=Caerostris darwini TaxID=1538125 RepID=A0AAV4WT80_9ARAC|nr:hypothetical protein CDAR_422231 [Caerostris darwini]
MQTQKTNTFNSSSTAFNLSHPSSLHSSNPIYHAEISNHKHVIQNNPLIKIPPSLAITEASSDRNTFVLGGSASTLSSKPFLGDGIPTPHPHLPRSVPLPVIDLISANFHHKLI